MDQNITYIFQGSNYIDLTLYQYGREKCSSMHSCGPATHNHYLLHYVLEGSGNLTLGTDRQYQLHAGQAFLICPRCISTYVADKTRPWTYITVSQLADWCNLDRSYFGKIFKETVLVTPQEYIIRYRVNMACDLMKNTDLLIGDIAAQVGYENQLHFSRAFKNVMGMPPREWKKRNRLV